MRELVRSNDKEFKVTSLEDAKYYFIPDLIDYEGVKGLEDYYEELKNAESLEDFADIWNRNTDKYEDGSTLEVIHISSRDLMQPGENLGWCAPYIIADENIKFALNEGEITSIMVNGKEESPEGRNVSELLEKAEETGCTNCPWFEKCAAFDDADNMED